MKQRLKNWLKHLPPIRRLRDRLQPRMADGIKYDYNADCLRVWEKDVGFLKEQRFMDAYARGVNSGHKFGANLHVEWRVHICCWAASHARHLPGAFVECGVNTGICSLAVCDYIDINSTGKEFYLFDTFNGIPEAQMPEETRNQRMLFSKSLYEDCYEVTRANFAPFPKAKLVRGSVPDTLDSVAINQVCYLSIDMNLVLPEIAAMRFFWNKLVSGAPVILDDYGWSHHADQRAAMDDFANSQDVKIATLPTGQGLIFKP